VESDPRHHQAVRMRLPVVGLVHMP
jgi:hypothetical protein